MSAILSAAGVAQKQPFYPLPEQSNHVTVEGLVAFSKDDQDFLLEVFSSKNFSILTDGCNPTDVLNVKGQPVKVTYDPKNRRHIELDKFPDIVFKIVVDWEDDFLRDNYKNIGMAREAIAKHNLDHLVVPEASIMHFTYGRKANFFLAIRKVTATPSTLEATLSPEDHEKQLQEIIRQLTIFICDTGLGNIARNKLLLQENKERGLHLVLDNDEFFKSDGPDDGGAGLMKWYPQYANLIIETAKKQNLPVRQAKKILAALSEAAQKVSMENSNQK